MNIRGAIFDLDGTLTDSMYIWQKAPVDLVRRYGGDPPEDLARDLKEMGRREAAEYLRSRFSLSTTPEELMECKESYTGQYLRQLYDRQHPATKRRPKTKKPTTKKQ